MIAGSNRPESAEPSRSKRPKPARKRSGSGRRNSTHLKRPCPWMTSWSVTASPSCQGMSRPDPFPLMNVSAGRPSGCAWLSSDTRVPAHGNMAEDAVWASVFVSMVPDTQTDFQAKRNLE